MRPRNAERIDHRQERAIVALLNEQTIQKAAESVGISDRTLHRWLAEPEFAERYRRARREAFGQAIALTQRYAPLAVNTLAKVMLDAAAPINAKVQAATAILKFGREGLELDDLSARIEALERAACGDDRDRRPQRAA
jgi:hypothetical protein